MIELRLLCLSLCLLLLLGEGRTSCAIPKSTMETNHLFLSYENNAYDLLTSNIVEVSRHIYLVCDGGAAPSTFVCGAHGSFIPALPTKNCHQELKPTIIVDTNEPSCQPFKMYRVGFNYGGRFLEVYRSCYDEAQYAALFSIHKVYRSTEFASRPSSGFTLDGAMTVKESNAFRNAQIFKCFTDILCRSQSYMTEQQHLFNHGHLTPDGDFPFRYLQKSTHKLRNCVPQYGAVNNGNWKSVESWIRRLNRMHDTLNVCTGTLGVHKLENTRTHTMTPIYLLNNRIPVPEWTYKIVSNLARTRYVLLTYNNIYATRRPDPRSFCTIIGCDADLNRGGVGFTFCCDPVKFITQNVPHLNNNC